MSADAKTRAAPFVEHAHRYTELGWALVRLNGKKPKDEEWQKARPGEPGFVAGEWSRWGERFNVGVVLGPSRLAVVEPDTPAAHERLLELLGGELPAVPTVKTGGRSLHLYFRDGGQGNTALEGLELRADGQQCVLPPSVHPESGRRYVWLPGTEPWLVEPGPIPDVLLEHFFGAERRKGRARPIPAEIGEGDRHSKLMSLAGTMRWRNMSGTAILAALRATNEERCRPPLPDDELVRMAEDAAGYEPQPEPRPTSSSRRAAEDASSGAAHGLDGPFVGIAHDDVLKLDLPEASCLIDDLVEQGTVGTIAGVPETHKSFLAQAIAVAVAAGEGEILGRRVVEQAAVGYFWQDDSERNEVARIKLYERAGGESEPGLQLRWFLNEGLRLPDDVDRLRVTVEAHELRLVVLDSFYNVAAGVSLRDEDAALVIQQLKAEVCDPTGCTVLIVDHAPWPTDSNRGQLRAFGSVFKGAAIRWGIYLQREGRKLFASASGNNIRGFPRTPVLWDEEALELRLVEVARVDEDELDSTVSEYVVAHPGESTTAIAKGLKKSLNAVRPALRRLSEPSEAEMAGILVCKPSRELGMAGTGRYWFPHNHAASEPSVLFGMAQDGSEFDPKSEGEPSEPSAPRRGDGSADGSPEGVDLEPENQQEEP